MTEIEQKALVLLNKVQDEQGYVQGSRLYRRDRNVFSEALCRAIEQHEAFRQEVSDAVEVVVEVFKHEVEFPALERFIIPKPKPDPLAQTLGDFDGTLWEPEDVLRFRAALEARGLEIREKNDD